MEDAAEIINVAVTSLLTILIMALGYFYRKDQKEKDIKYTKMESHFQKFMDSQQKINLENTKILTRLTTLQEVRESGG